MLSRFNWSSKNSLSVLQEVLSIIIGPVTSGGDHHCVGAHTSFPDQAPVGLLIAWGRWLGIAGGDGGNGGRPWNV